MTRCFCDRCGAPVHTKHRYTGDHNLNDRSFELCSDCNERLKSWMDECLELRAERSHFFSTKAYREMCMAIGDD